MVVMALEFVSRPAYLLQQFFESKALKLLLARVEQIALPKFSQNILMMTNLLEF